MVWHTAGYGAGQDEGMDSTPVPSYHVPEEINRFIHYFHQHIMEQVLYCVHTSFFVLLSNEFNFTSINPD